MRTLFIAIALLLFSTAAGSAGELGMPSPEVTLPSLSDGSSMRLSDLRGKIVYVDFWASWCGPCRQSLPELDRIRKTYVTDFEVFAINLDEDPADGLAFLEKFPVSYPVVSDASAKFPGLFGVKGMPTSYLLDRDGNVRYVHEGYRDGDAKKIEAIVRQLIAEK